MSERDSAIDPTAETVATGGGAKKAGEPGEALDTTATDHAAKPSSAADGESTLVGHQLAHFRIDQLLGRGGMGEVYLATDLALDRQVAIKLISRAIAQDEKLRRRFFREARSQARLHHPNVCHIYYIGEQDGQLFFAMEYIDGDSLSAHLEREGALSVARAMEYGRMASLGLREAYRHGFTHRDVKPSNLMLDRNGTIKVVDFGLVKETEERGGTLPDGETTIEGTTIVGTPLYMAPEQARGDKVDHRADVYSLGATLHHLVSGKPPFEGPTAMAIVSRHLTEPRPRLETKRRRRRGPAPIDVLCDRMMEKSPDARFSDYDELLATIENISPARTRPAGFWVRAFAIVLDLIIVQLINTPVGMLTPIPIGVSFGFIALVYSILCHGRWGQTLGKAALEIEVVPVERSGPPGYRTGAIRFLSQAGLLYVLVGAAMFAGVLPHEAFEYVLRVVTFVVALVLYPLEGALSAWLVPNKRTLWDRAAGTRVRYRRLRE